MQPLQVTVVPCQVEASFSPYFFENEADVAVTATADIYRTNDNRFYCNRSSLYTCHTSHVTIDLLRQTFAGR